MMRRWIYTRLYIPTLTTTEGVSLAMDSQTFLNHLNKWNAQHPSLWKYYQTPQQWTDSKLVTKADLELQSRAWRTDND